MKFQFPFETLMKARRARRNEAERDYRLALAKADEQRNRLQNMRSEMSNARVEMQNIRENGGKLNAALVSVEDYLVGQKIRIQIQLKTLKGLDEIVEQKRLILVEAAKELKSLEKLREKRYTEFKVQVRKKELKNIDEISVMRAARSKMV